MPHSRINNRPSDHSAPHFAGRLTPAAEPDDVLSWQPRSRRAPWRQHLVDAEHGLREGLRRDSTLCMHLFVDCLILVVCGGLGLAVWQWAVLSLTLTGMLAVEFFHHALRVMSHLLPDRPAAAHVQRLGTAGALVATVGGIATILLLLADRLYELFGR